MSRISYPPELPVSQHKDELLEAIRDHQVVVVAGETGSGKTTQLPKICLELGRGSEGIIGHTQPRRLAARTVAERIAEELHTGLGDVVGYTVRFTDQVSEQTQIRLMTDGILLTEIQRDRLLRRYDTLIIDEAHERSLNIDFILGYLKRLLPQRPDLKVIITSATIDPARFSKHFGDAPVVEVSGRTYPVEVRYRPVVDPDDESTRDRDQVQAISDAVQELLAEKPGDVLVFLSGEREIRDTAEALGKLRLRDTEVLPLYARLSSAEQHRVFEQHRGRRIVLATNVAETSLTVPGIRYVIDPGTARISRYSNRTKVQRLPIEAVSQASANQRKGRCGRISEGICVRLYTEEDFTSRPEFTDPEILRTNLASVILQMTALGLGDVTAFPFMDPPDSRQIRDGVHLLHELGALKPGKGKQGHRLTSIGRKLARLPIDPRLGRMVLEAGQRDCVREVLVIVAALSIQDPRERPAEREQEADQAHARFADDTSDFLAYLNLWRYLREQQRDLSSTRFRKMCRQEFLHYLRIREWQDLHGQLRQLLKPLGITANRNAAGEDQIHQAVLAGLLSHVGVKDGPKNDYLGARGARFGIFPGSGLFKKTPEWVMAAELVETSRLWARVNAKVEPSWIEDVGAHLVRRTYAEPHWEKNRAAVTAYERVTLYGVPVVTARKVNYGRIDPELSRELFIRHALVEGDWETHHEFFHKNRALLEEVEELEHRTRRRDILVDEDTLFDFYDSRVGKEVVSGGHFDGWWKRTRRTDPGLLDFDTSLLIRGDAGDVSEDDYPDVWVQGDLRLPLTYSFEPGAAADGVTVQIPLPVLNQVRPAGFDWQVPGLREELVIALIRSLPKQLRRNLVPVPDHARDALRHLRPDDRPLTEALADELWRMRAVEIHDADWDLARVPDHLRMTFRIEDEDGTRVAEGKVLTRLKRDLRHEMLRTLSAGPRTVGGWGSDEAGSTAASTSRSSARDARAGAPGPAERSGIRTWDLEPIPEVVEFTRQGHTVVAYPALVDDGDSVSVRVLDTPARQRAAHWAGVRRLLLCQFDPPVGQVERSLDMAERMALAGYQHGGARALLEDCVSCAVDGLMSGSEGAVRTKAEFDRLLSAVRAGLYDVLSGVVHDVVRIVGLAHEVDVALGRVGSAALKPAAHDMQTQLGNLVYPGFVTATGRERLPHLVRYLRAILQRLDKLPDSPDRDAELMDRVAAVQHDYDVVLAGLPEESAAAGRDADAHMAEAAATHQKFAAGQEFVDDQDLREVRWLIEELRVSFFAQRLGTPKPISEKRIYRILDRYLG